MRVRPKLTLSASSANDLLTQLRAIDIAVPLVSEGRTKEHRECYMMARFAATAAQKGWLNFPCDLVHSEKPDFLLRLAGLEIGVECVEAVPTEHYQIEVLREKNYPDALNFMQHFEPGDGNFTRDEKHEIASGQRAGRPSTPKTSKRNWLSAMEYVVSGKTAKLRQGNYASNRATWLVVQDEWPSALHFYPNLVREAAEELREKLEPLFVSPSFQAVFIASGDQLLCFKRSGLTIEEICNVWD